MNTAGALTLLLLASSQPGDSQEEDVMLNKVSEEVGQWPGVTPVVQYERQRYDGWYNNLAHPGWGTVDSHLVRKTPPSYADGVYMMSGGNRCVESQALCHLNLSFCSRPSPRDLSQTFMKGADGLGSLMNRTAMQTFFGQVGLEDMSLVTG